MFELTKAEDLVKAGHAIGNYFAKQAEELEKTFAFHKAQATHHEAMAGHHADRSTHYKAMHAGVAADHELHDHFHKSHVHHDSMHKLHKACADSHHDQADKCKTQMDTLKTMATEWGASRGAVSSLFARSAAAAGAPLTTTTGNPFEDMVKETTAQLAKKTLETFDNDAEVKQFMRETIMKMVGEAIGNTIVPTGVSAVTPTHPGITAVPRNGQPAPAPVAIPAEPNVPLEFKKLFSVEDGEPERRIL